MAVRRVRLAGSLLLAIGSCSLAGAISTTSPASATPSAPGSFSLSSSPGLEPAFNPNIFYYVVPCTQSPSTTISTSGPRRVTIAGKGFMDPATVSVPLAANQAVTVGAGGGAKYTIRCLPADFPAYTATETGNSQGSGFLVALAASGSPGTYIVAFDAHDVPVWWERQASANNPEFVSGSEIGWWTGLPGKGFGFGQYNLYSLAGAPLLTLGGSVNSAAAIDFHDFQKVSKDRYLATMYVPNQPADLSSWGLSSTAPVTDGQVVELNAQSQIVWSWSALAHINPATANVNWRNQYPDVFHINAVQMVGNQVILSFRHLDTVYGIDAKTGNIVWQLGGVPSAKSLTVVGNSTFNAQSYPQLFSGQHDAKLLPDGTLTVHDNAALENLPSRALRFQINTQTMTATVLEDVTDADHPGPSSCCGSAQKLASGDWLVDWGAGNYVAELDPEGNTVNQIAFPPDTTYRTAPVLPSDHPLSNGMDAMVPQLKLS